jgi:large repetitive protein
VQAHKTGTSGPWMNGFDAATSVRVASKSSARETYFQNRDGSHTVQLFQSPVNYQDGAGNWQPINTTLVAGPDGRWQEQANSVGVSLASSSAGAPAASVQSSGVTPLRVAAPADAGPSPSASAAPSDSVPPSAAPTASDSPSATPSASASPSATPSASASPSATPSASASPSDSTPGTGQLAELTLGSGESASWSLAGAAGVTAQVSGSTASYPGILPDTTLELSGTASGVKESIVLGGPDAPTSWVFPMDLQGLTLSTDAQGDVGLVDSSGTEVATLPQPYAYDSASDTAQGLPDETFAMQYQIITYDGGPAVELSLPSSYTSSGLTYPVTVDPTVVESIAGQNQTTYIAYGQDQDYSTSNFMVIGTNNSGTYYSVSLLKFPSVPTDNGAHITAATLSLWDAYASQCTQSASFKVMPVTSAWTASGKKQWSDMPGTGAQIGAWSAVAPAAACANTSYNPDNGGSLSVSLSTSYLQQIALGQTPDYGFAIEAGSNTNNNYYKLLTSDNYAARSPSLSITYSAEQAPDIEHTWPTPGYQASTLTPELEAQAVDPDTWPNASLTYDFAIYDSQGAQVATSGSIAAPDWQVPAGKLHWNSTYQWSVSAYDGFDTVTSATSPLETVTAQPLVSSSLAQNGGAGYSPQTGNYTASATDARENVVGPKLALVRSYNSLDGQAADSFGQGWSSAADMRAAQDQDGSGNVVITDDTGQQSRYGYDPNPPAGKGSYSPPLGSYAQLTAVSGGGYQLIDKQDTTYLFTQADGTGTWLITSITTKAGLQQTFAYTGTSQKYLSTVTDVASGRKLTFAWTTLSGAAYPHVHTVTTDDAVPGNASTASLWTYQYTGDELTSVCPPAETASDTASASCDQYTYQTGTDYPAALLDAGPYSYWRLAEPSGSTSAVSAVLSNEGADNGLYPTSGVTLGSPSYPGPLAGGSTDAARISNAYVQLPGNLVASSSYQSIALWFKSASPGILFSYEDSAVKVNGTTTGNYTPSLYIGSDGKLNGEFWYSGHTAPVTSSAVVDDGQWHFAVLTSAGATQTLYLDGAAQGTLSGAVAPFPDGTEHEYLGAGFWGGTWPDEPDQGASGSTGYADYLNGQVAEAAFFTSPLPATQVTQLYNDARQSSAWLTKHVTPGNSTAAQVTYNSADGRVNTVTDQNGGTWKLGEPATSGTAAPFASAVLGQSPDGYWRLGDGAGSALAADEVTGGSGSYNDVTLGAGGPFGSSGPTAASFGGTDSALELPSGEFSNSTSGATVETIGLWFSTTHAGQVLASLNDNPVVGNGTSTDYTPLLYIGSDGKLIGGPNTAHYVESTAKVNDGKWHYAMLVLNSAVSPPADALYLDDARVGLTSGTVVGGGTITDSEIGAGYLGGAWPDQPDSGATATPVFFNGSIAEVFHIPGAIGGTSEATLFSGAENSNGKAATETVTVTDPGTNTLTYTYDLQNGGRILSQTDGTGAPTSYGYDTGGFLYTVTHPDGDIVTTAHDVRGNVTSKTTCQDLAGNVCSTSYYTYYPAGNGNAQLTPDPRNNAVLTASDGRSASASDTTYQTTYAYNPLGEVTAKKSPAVTGYAAGMTTTSTYTSATTAAYGGGNTPAGLLQSKTNADGAVTSYAYYADGDLALKTTALGETTLYTNDGLGNVATETATYSPLATCAAPGSGATYGSCANTANNSGCQSPCTLLETARTSFAYDPQGRVLTETDPATTDAVTGKVHTQQFSYTYDNDGDMLTEVQSDLTGGDPSRTTANSYNGDDQLQSATDPAGQVTGYTYDSYGNIKTRTDPNGAIHDFTYDADSRRLTETIDNFTGTGPTPAAPATKLFDQKLYDGDGRLITDTNAVGVTTTNAYYDNGLLKQVTETGADGTTKYVAEQDGYDAAGNLTSKVTLNGTLTTDYLADAADRTYQTTVDPAGLDKVTKLTLSASGQVLTFNETDAAGDTPIQRAYTYDAAGDELTRAVSGSSSGTLTTKWAYDTRGVQETMTDPGTNVTSYVTDANGQVTQTIQPAITVTAEGGATSTVSPATLTGYDTYGDIAETEDADGNITSYGYDGDGRKTGETLPAYTPPDGTGTVTPTEAWTYTPGGQVHTATVQQGTAASPQASTTTYSYDQLGDQVQQVNPAINEQGTMTQGTSTAVYNLAGQALSRTDPYGSTAYQSYDALDRPWVSSENTYLSPTATGEVGTTDAYNTAGELASATTLGGVVISYTYYADGELASKADTTLDTTRYAYDLLGDTIKSTLPDQSSDTATYDGAGRETGTAQLSPTGTVLRSTSSAYSPLGYLTSATNADQHTETFGYDADGNLTTQTEPVTDSTLITTKFGYDANGNETAYTDGNQKTTYYTYNPWNLKQAVTRPATPSEPSDNTTTASYTADGLVAQVQLPGGVTQNYAYDALGDLTAETGSGATAATVCRDFQYDLDQNIVAAGCATGTGAGWEYPTWNALGENLGNTGQAGATSFAYTPDGQLASRTDTSGTSTFTYDTDGRQLTDTDALTGLTIGYTYNQLSQPKTITYGSGGNVRTFGYTPEHQLQSDTLTTSGGTAIGSVSYSYDPNGQLTGETTTGLAGAGTQAFSYDYAGRLTSWTNTPSGSSAAVTGYTYDGDGNRLTAGPVTYTYNAQDQLTSDGTSSYSYTPDGDIASVTAAGSTVSYTSDAFGQQVSNGTRTATYDAFGRALTSGTATFSYADLGNNLASAAGGSYDGSATTTYSHDANGQLIADNEPAHSGAARLMWTGQHGDVVGYFTGTGSTTAGSAAYDPWGNLTAAAGHMTDLGYQGEYTDSSGTAVLMGARWYNPDLGQFQNADTYVNSPTPLSVNANLYAYAGDSPLDYTDPTGHYLDGGGGGLLGDLESATEDLIGVDIADQAVPGVDVVSDVATAIVGTATVVVGGVEYLTGSSSSTVSYAGGSPAPSWSAFNGPGASWNGYGSPAPPTWNAPSPTEPAWTGSGASVPGYYQGPSPEQQARQAHHLADEHRQYLQYLARKAAEKRAALERQRRIDARDAEATAHVGKARITRDGTGAFGGHGKDGVLSKTVGATANLLADIAGKEASQAQADGSGQGGGDDGGAGTVQGPPDGPSCGGQSFTATTRVLLADGTTTVISSLKPGDKVEAADTKTGKDQAETVTAVLVHHDTDLYDLTIKTSHGTAVIHTTSNHLFWDPERGRWVRAAGLRTGEHLKTPDGSTVIADGGTTPTVHDGTMWDLTVPGNNDHDFYVISGVGATGQLGRGSYNAHNAEADSVPVLVHNNSCPSGFDDQAASESGERPDKGGLTRAGREYQKHMGRGELPGVSGSGLDSAGQNLLDEILSDPNADYQSVTGGGFAGGTRVIGNSIVNDSFVGATFDSNGFFQYFGVYP